MGAKGFAEEIGVDYKFVNSSFSDIIADLSGTDPETGEKKEIKGDIIETGFTVLSYRKEFVDFSKPVFPTQVWLVTGSENSLSPITPEETTAKDIKKVKDLIEGKSVLGIRKTCLDPGLYNLSETGAKPIFFNGSVNDLAPAVINYRADATLLDVADTLIALEKWPGKIKVIGPVGHVQNMAAAFRKDSPDLRKAYNDYFEKICKNGEYQKIVKKYYPMVFNYYPEFFKKCLNK
jgi:ABC-type amino acid transport substrate-binding protein